MNLLTMKAQHIEEETKFSNEVNIVVYEIMFL
jgi:hypothetical protein